MKKVLRYLYYPFITAAVALTIITGGCKKKSSVSDEQLSIVEKKARAKQAAIERAKKLEEKEAAKSRGRKNWDKLARPNIKQLFAGKGKILDHINNHTWQKLVWLEALGPHYPAHMLEGAFKEWEKSDGKGGRPLVKKNFINWLEEDYLPRELACAVESRVKAAEKLQRSRVVWLNDVQRKTKLITVNHGLLYDFTGNLFHTGKLFTNHSKYGAAVFVLSQEDKLYAGGHGQGVDGRNMDTHFFHASFLGGAPVFGAGEIGVNKGKIVWISPKSGHYRPEEKEMLYFLKWLKDRGVNLSGVGVSVVWTTLPMYYDAARVLAQGSTTGLIPLYDNDSRPKVLP